MLIRLISVSLLSGGLVRLFVLSGLVLAFGLLCILLRVLVPLSNEFPNM